MNISYNLQKKKRKNSDKASIRISISIDGKRIQKNTGLVIEEGFWEHQKQKVKKTQEQSQIINAKLSEFNNIITKKYFELIGSDQYQFNEFKSFVNSLFGDRLPEENEELSKIKSLQVFFNEFIDYKRNKQTDYRTIQRYKNAFRHLKNALSQLPIQLKSEDIIQYTKHLSKKEKLQNITIDSNFRSLKVFLSWLETNKNIGQSAALNEMKNIKKEWNLTKKTEIHPLEYNEVQLIQNYEPSKLSLQKTKDLFLFQIYTAMRFGDLKKLNSTSFIENDQLKYRSEKTGEDIFCYLPPIAQKIRDKYSCKLPKYSNQKYNNHIKDLCKEAGINRTIETYEYRGNHKSGKRIEQKLWEKISSHDARRTFVNIAFDLGLSLDDIREYTGHTGKEVLELYVLKKQQRKSIIERSRKVWEKAV